jgi:hypothetical protein
VVSTGERGPAVIRRAFCVAVHREGRGRDDEARHSHEWRVLAGFWREKAVAGRVPSLISGVRRCENARRGIFAHYPRGVRARSERPSIPTRLRRPFFLALPEGAGGTFSDGILAGRPSLRVRRRIDGGAPDAGCARASMRRVRGASPARAISAVLPVPIAHSSHRSGVCPARTALGNNTYGCCTG